MKNIRSNKLSACTLSLAIACSILAVPVSAQSSNDFLYSQQNNNITIQLFQQPTIKVTSGGTVKLSPSDPQPQDEVIITLTPFSGCSLSDIVVSTESGNTIPLTKKSDGTYSFVQPDNDVFIDVAFDSILSANTGTNSSTSNDNDNSTSTNNNSTTSNDNNTTSTNTNTSATTSTNTSTQSDVYKIPTTSATSVSTVLKSLFILLYDLFIA